MRSQSLLCWWTRLLLLAICTRPLAIAAQDQADLDAHSTRNNVAAGGDIPNDWEIGRIIRKSDKWTGENARNIKWVSKLGSQCYSSPVVANGQVYVGTNNGAGYLPRYPRSVDLGCLICFDESDGRFLWQYSAEKLPIGRVHDWPMYGIRSSPLVDGDRLWLVDNRCRVVCLDPRGFSDGEDDGPVKARPEIAADMREADVVWQLDMIAELGVSPHNWSMCSPASFRDLLFITTGNGVDESHNHVPAPDAPSFIAVDKPTGRVIWTDSSPGKNILHGQWSSPAVGVLGDVPQVIFGGGDGWVYSFRADAWNRKESKPILLWKFDANPKDSQWIINGRGTRNSIVASPVIHEQRVFITVGQDPEHSEGEGHLWCLDPTRRGDVSSQLAFKVVDGKRVPLPPRRLQAVDPKAGEIAVPNPNSAVIWDYEAFDLNGDGKTEFDETMHRTVCRPSIKDNLLFLPDYSGIVHCLNATTGKPHWTCDLYACAYGAPLIVDSRVFIGDQDGDVVVLPLSSDPGDSVQEDGMPTVEMRMNRCIYGDAVAANGVLYIVANTHLFAIANKQERVDP